MDPNQPPIVSDTPFSKKYPFPGILGLCSCCLPIPFVRGIPSSATRLSDVEVNEIVQKIQGHWYIQPLEAAKGINNVQFTDVEVTGTRMIISGGVHNTTHRHGNHRHRSAVANRTQEQSLGMMHRGPDGVLYVDFSGSIMEDFDPEGGEVTFNNSLGMRLKFVRGWKRDGLPPPTTTSTAPPVVPVSMGGSDGRKFCAHCGLKVIAVGTIFCPECGGKQG
mmetsp:Transcript_22767/g.35661  ORF Transcript_22767/g.35661 Transcript_22767/m.35661 type:complete len:220 (-) Transcript_22767:167-826(-)|eukprot:CAMPEP_0184300648 /NCGR_PEP_ID=MMETSP1049-20130417/11025_1 /TAXON_ID=77928 /ORGANISM="Proteomonas sulcata, Strain CCMP704" /LENGTH=219 /DNA_ID=CAMNT_0026611429 /DNA_START=157 /DNA_END=816 /DNA_ORIENTATION=+